MCWSSYEKRLLLEEQEKQEKERDLGRWDVESETDLREEVPAEEPERELVRV